MWMANIIELVFPIHFLIFFKLSSADWDSNRGGHGDPFNAGAGPRLAFSDNPVVQLYDIIEWSCDIFLDMLTVVYCVSFCLNCDLFSMPHAISSANHN